MLYVNIKYDNETGKNTFHPKPINWSYRYRGKAALIHTNKITKKQIFNPNQIDPGIKAKHSKGGSQPPKNKITLIELIINIFAYSPNENNAKPIAAYSTLYPETNSASASGKSKGWRFVSANAEVKNIKNKGKNGITNQILFW